MTKKGIGIIVLVLVSIAAAGYANEAYSSKHATRHWATSCVAAPGDVCPSQKFLDQLAAYRQRALGYQEIMNKEAEGINSQTPQGRKWDDATYSFVPMSPEEIEKAGLPPNHVKWLKQQFKDAGVPGYEDKAPVAAPVEKKDVRK